MSVRLLLSAGRGPRECSWAVARLVRRLEGEAARQDLTTRRIQTVPGQPPGTYRSVVVEILGGTAASFAATWTGTLCWQAPSPYRAGSGRKNWYVTAQPMPADAVPTTFAEADVEVIACRTGGPGGQHRNKVSTAARAIHRPTGTVVVVDTERQFSLNRGIAMRLLRQRIEDSDAAAERAVETARRQLHDQLVRGNPTRVERP